MGLIHQDAYCLDSIAAGIRREACDGIAVPSYKFLFSQVLYDHFDTGQRSSCNINFWMQSRFSHYSLEAGAKTKAF